MPTPPSGVTYDASNGLPLPPHIRYLAIDYTALSLVAPEKVPFRYKLEGQNRNWHEVVNDREVQYTNLAPKHYRFRVLACNNSGVWNEQGASLPSSASAWRRLAPASGRSMPASTAGDVSKSPPERVNFSPPSEAKPLPPTTG